ncbi:hypothetical protein [Streptomyces alanosinicus]|uniref:LPXTG cell wall anchor domain-containing protein n=1 Tax=Streptomyces alanosinicus TaxID=68171 RepID=A0A918YKL0_9ACTN|nr:hypothetical protein [Streptomyces alanosinicus]GHE05513.1 hypothetical protein GCM10010339_41650 [Streptomyces alanosinicus]
MRRTVRALSVAFVAGAALALAGPAASAAEVGPGTVPPTSTVAAPEGVPGACAAPQQCGTSQTGPTACRDGGPCQDGPGTACKAGGPCQDGSGCTQGQTCPGHTPCHQTGQCQGDGGGHQCVGGGGSGACADGTGDSDWGGGGGGGGGDAGGHQCTGAGACSDDGHGCGGPDDRQDHGGDGCTPPGVQHGVAAGDGGSFTDSVPALAAGTAFIAAACGGAGYRLFGRRRASGGGPTDM